MTAPLAGRTQALDAEPFFVQDGSLRAYIWPARQQFSFEVVDALGHKLFVGAERTLESARSHAVDMLRRLR